MEQHQPHLALITDNTDRSVAGAIGDQMSSLVTSINAPQVTPREPQQALLDVVEVYPYIDYIKYLLPGSVALAIFVTAMIGGGMLFIDDKSRGLHEGYMVTPITKWELILGFNLSGVIKAVLAGETVLVLGAVMARVPNFFEPVRLFELTLMVILTSIALIGMMFFIMARISDPLVPRAIFGVLEYAAVFPERRGLSHRGLPQVAARDVELRSVHLCGPRLPLAAAQGYRHRRRHHRYFRADVDFDRGAVGLDAAVPADFVDMPRALSNTAVVHQSGRLEADPRRRSVSAGIVVLQLEDLAGGAPPAGLGAGAARSAVAESSGCW